jgi:hypothetical protein
MNLTGVPFFIVGTPIKCYLYILLPKAQFENLLYTNSQDFLIWHTSKAMQLRVEMNDEYIALDCALLACRETCIEARLRKKKEVRKERG